MPPASTEPSVPVDLQNSGGAVGQTAWQDSSGTRRLCPPDPKLLKAQICAALVLMSLCTWCFSARVIANDFWRARTIKKPDLLSTSYKRSQASCYLHFTI